MKSKLIFAIALASVGAVTLMGQGQGQPQQPLDSRRTPGVQGPADPNHAAFVMANCKNPPAAAAPRAAAAPAGAPGGAPAGGPGGAPGGAPAAAAGGGRGAGGGAPAVDQDYTITAIPGVIAADAKWKIIWTDKGNNADGIVALDDGSLLLAQNDNSDVIKIDKDGKASVAYKDTYTGGSLAANSKGQLFIGERALGNAVWQLEPTRKLIANTFNGEPLDCVAGIINDMSADNKGGIYMTMGGIYYVNPQGVVLPRQDNPPVGGNGIILSPDGKTLYATGRVGGAGGGGRGAAAAGGAAGAPGAAPAAAPAAGGQAPAAGAPAAAAGGRGGGGGGMGGLVAWDVQPDGSLTNERQFAETCGDGSTIDASGRIFCTGGRMPDPNDPTKTIAGIGVISPEGKILGIIPTPQGVISLAFGGPGKKTLFAAHIRDVEIMSIPMLTEGYKGRPK